jgi:pimeloyl-ACP methyl ester carboxylesterase
MTSVYNRRVNDVSETLPFRLETADSTLNGLIDLPVLSGKPGERPAVVICSGSAGLEWAFLPYLATLLAARGFVAIRTGARQPGDVLAVLEALGETIAPGRVDRRRLGLFGPGEGAGTAILAAGHVGVRALVTWGAVMDTALAGVHAPWLIVQGSEDLTVPVDADRRAGSEREILVIPGASHSFGTRHPFAGPTPQLIQALNATQRWFRAHL